MANWRYTIELNQVMNKMAERYDFSIVEDKCSQEVKDAIIKEISKAEPLKRFVANIQKAKTIAAVNRVLNNIYNEADYQLVWCGI